MKIDKNNCWPIIFLTTCSLVGWSESAPTVDDRISDMEAKTSILESRIKSVEDLAGQESASKFNPGITVVGDFHGTYGFGVEHEEHHHGPGHHHDQHHDEFTNGVAIKHLELELRGAVDPFADALVVLGIDDIGYGKTPHLDVEEAYARLKRWPGLGFAPFELKVGLFKLAIGRMNRLHAHNFNQIGAPMAMQRFLGDEGYAAPGLSANFSFATSNSSALTIFVEGVANNRLDMQEKGAEKSPSGVVHAWWHTEVAPSHYLDFGASGLVGQGKETKLGAFLLVGGDLHYTYQPLGYGQNPWFIFGNEFYTANKPLMGTTRWPMGNFTWAQMYLFDSTFVGLRYDLAPQEKEQQKLEHAAGLYFSHYTTEFLRFRLGYEHVMPEFSSFDGDHRLTLSMMFVLGNHPVEPYFANR